MSMSTRRREYRPVLDIHMMNEKCSSSPVEKGGEKKMCQLFKNIERKKIEK